MKIVAVSDIHIQGNGMFAKPLPRGQTTRSELSFKFLKWLDGYCQQVRADLLVITGDIFSQRLAVPTAILNRTIESFKKICSGTPVVAIPGNHDRFMWSKSEMVHSLYALRTSVPNFTVIDGEPWVREFFSPQGNITIFGIPAGRADLLPDLPKLALEKGRGFSLLLLHENIVGARFSSGAAVAEGTLQETIWSTLGRLKLDMAICGDIHLSQSLPEGRPDAFGWFPIREGKTILVPGSPYQMDFGDEGHSHGVWVIDTDMRAYLFCPYEGAPKHFTITEETFRPIHKLPANTYYRFRLSDPEKIRMVQAAKVKGEIECTVEVVPVESTRVIDEEVRDVGDVWSLFESYVRTWSSREDAESLVKIGRALLDKATSEVKHGESCG